MTRWTLALFISGCVTGGIDLESPIDGTVAPDSVVVADRFVPDGPVDAARPNPDQSLDGASPTPDATVPGDAAVLDPDADRDGQVVPDPDARPPEPDAAACTPEAEVCNGVDDDCDLAVDEAVRCALPEAESMCVDGACALVACADGFFDANGEPEDGCERGCRAERASLLGAGLNSMQPRVAVDGDRWAALRVNVDGLLLQTDRGAFAVPTPDAPYTSIDVAAAPAGWLTAVEVLDPSGAVDTLQLSGLDEGGRVAYTRITDHTSAGRAALTVNHALGVAGLAHTVGEAGLGLLFFDVLDPANLSRATLLPRVSINAGVRPDIVPIENGFGVVAAGVDTVIFVEALAGGDAERRWLLGLRESPVEVSAATGADGIGIHWRLEDGEHGFAVLKRDEAAPWQPVFAELQPDVVFHQPAVLSTEAGFAALSLRDTFVQARVQARLFGPRGAAEAGSVDLVTGRPYLVHARGDRAVYFEGRANAFTVRFDCR